MTSTTAVNFNETDGTIANCIGHAKGNRAYEDFTIFDHVAEVWGAKAEIMRGCLKPTAKTVRVRFEMTGEDRLYTDLAAAKRAIIRAAH
jgi:NADH dehydrogenase/NADH:ubiquinone oxidoreductase subunit G